MADYVDRDLLLKVLIHRVKGNEDNFIVLGTNNTLALLEEWVRSVSAVDAVEVVRCKDCRWARPYERTDGETGYYCHFCGHSFKYGTNWERLFTPIKESDDFCSYGERRADG